MNTVIRDSDLYVVVDIETGLVHEGWSTRAEAVASAANRNAAFAVERYEVSDALPYRGAQQHDRRRFTGEPPTWFGEFQ